MQRWVMVIIVSVLLGGCVGFAEDMHKKMYGTDCSAEAINRNGGYCAPIKKNS